ncbi:hypothetical protein AUP43_16070 [Oceanibaculum pacificum]|uniref:Uncharacterized protein n=2 Tax=Oceanibaculum pacificum TaxID=580166 RepID=A0A154WG79_9PROT|nr:hypothetical protein AUP43_16070 [Oceanibaculum pacificum]
MTGVIVVRRKLPAVSRGKPLLDRSTRDRLLAEAAEGESDQALAEEYGLSEAQVRKLRHNHRHRLAELRQRAEEQAAEPGDVPPPLRLAFRTLGDRTAALRHGAFLLDGRPADLRRIVAAANRIRQAEGAAPIRYPGVLPLIERACR